MATTYTEFRPNRRLGGYHTPALSGLETASSVWERGDILVFTSGKLALAAANPRDIAGVAEQEASGTTDKERSFVPALSDLTFTASLDDGTGTRALVQTDVGTAYGITRDATQEKWYVDSAKVTAGTNTAVRVVKLIDPVGSTADGVPSTATADSGKAIVEVVFLTEATMFQTAAS